MDKAPKNNDEERANAEKELQSLKELNAQDTKLQSAMIDEMEKSGSITKEKADELRKIGGILKDGEDKKPSADTKEPGKATKVKYSEAEKASQFVNLSTNISDEKKKIIEAINKTGTFRYGKLKKLKDVLYRLEFIEDSINSDNQNEVPRIGVSLIENLPDDFDKKSLHKLDDLSSKYEELLLSKKDNEQEEISPDTENKDGADNLEKIEAKIRAIKKDNDFIKKTKENLVAKGCPKTEAQTMATCEEAINRAQAKTNILIKNPGAKDAEARLKEFEKIITDNSAKLSELRLKNNIEETKVDETKTDDKETTKTDTDETKTGDTVTNPDTEPKQMSPEEIAALERLLYTAEAKASLQLESSKFKNGIIKGLSKWEKFGQGEEGAKGFIKRYTKTAINLALIGVISSLSVQKLAENGIGTATALGGSVTTALTKKMAMGLGFGGIMEMAPEKAKKWLTVGVGLGSVALATVLTGGGAGVMAAGSFIVGYGAQKFINGKFTDEKIAEKEEKAKIKFLEKVKLENTSISEDKVKEIEAQYSKILKKYENQRIWGKMADGISKLTVGSMISGLTMEASGRINDNLHHQTSEISTKNEGIIIGTKDSIVTQDHNGIVAEQNDSIAKPDTTNVEVIKTDSIAEESVHDAIKDSVEIKADTIKHEGVIISERDSTTVSTDTIKHEEPIVAVKDSTITAQDSIKETEHINSGSEIKTDSIKHEESTAVGTPAAKAETEIKLSEEQLKNVIIQKGEGIEHSFIRQIENDHKLAEDLGYKGDVNDEKALHAFAGRQAHVLAIKEGYVEVGENGEMKEVRIAEAGKVGHLIKMENGHATATEVTAEGKVLEVHHEGDKFESEPDKHEYIKGGSTTNNGEEITNTPHVESGSQTIVSSEETITQTPHITAGSDMYSEDPATYLGQHDTITPTDHVEPGKVDPVIENKNIDQHFTKPEDTGNENIQKEESLVHELTNKELRQIERIHDHNIHRIFPNNYDEQNWHEVKNMDASKLYHLKINEISEEYKPLHHYIHKLSVITGFEPLPGDNFHEPETNDHFIREALKEAARLGKMDQVKL